MVRMSVGPSETFDIGSLKPGERFTLLFWMEKPFAGDESINVTHQYGSFPIDPSFTITADEYNFYRRGYYFLTVLVVLLSTATLVLAAMVYRMWPRSASQAAAAAAEQS